MRIKNILCVLFVSFVLFGTQSVLAENTSEDEVVASFNTVEEGKICKAKPVKSNMICFETIEYSPEIKTYHQNKEITYRKNVTIKREFKKANQNKSLEQIANCETKLTFTYDKNSFVECTYKTPEKNKGDYFLKPLIEILPEDDVATISIKYTLYEKKLLEVYDYIFDGHIDLFCSEQGDIGVNSDIN